MVNRINTNINLEAEFGDLLDKLVEYIPHMPEEDVVEHFGVKGMKWGVRKASEPGGKTKGSSLLVGLGPDKVSRKTPSGEVITLTKDPPIPIARLLSKISSKSIDKYNNGAFITIRDGSGKKVGEAQVEKRSDDELNLLWLGINNDSRGKGYATQAMKAAEEFGRSAGFKKLTLEVPGDAPDALHIYTKLGFKNLGPTEGSIKDDFWGGLTNMEYVFDDVKHSDIVLVHSSEVVWVPEESLAHFGVKGMRWGKRKTESSSEKTPRTNAQKKEIAKNVAIGTGVLIAAAGAAYLGHKLNQNGSVKMSDIKVSSESKKKVNDMFKEPTTVIHASRGRNQGFKFYKDGQIPDPMVEWQKGFGGLEESRTVFNKYDGKIAARFMDPDGRTDRAGRLIPHDIIVPKSMSDGVNSIDDVLKTIWPKVKDHYSDNYENLPDGKIGQIS